MAGVTNNAFMILCKQQGAGLLCSEMISDAGVVRQNKKTLDMIKYDKTNHPISIQIFGENVNELTCAAKYIEKTCKPDIIDLNCGCPARKVAISKKAGCALMKHPDKIVEIIKSLKSVLTTPVSIKIRSGWDDKHINAIEIAVMAEKAGVDAIIIHPRTKVQEFSGKSDWEIIKKIKQAVDIPVIGSGDIKTCFDAQKMLKETKCDAVMIGRASIGNPWIFKECNQYISKKILPKQISIKQRVLMIIKHLELLKKDFGEKRAILLIRQHLSSYFFSILNRKQLIKDLILENNYETMIKKLKKKV